MDVIIEPSWKKMLLEEFEAAYFRQITIFLKTEKALNKTIYPPGPLIFNAFQLTPFENVKVVILGQDPYHGPNQAHGLSFSVPKGIKPPPSLVNILKELEADIGIKSDRISGDLSSWAQQGVLLLNASLTVRDGEPNSHAMIGWSTFTDKVIETLSRQKTNLVFLLWGKFAGAKASLIEPKKHLILKCTHPSPFSADKGFFGCRHFSKTNEYLTGHGITPIDWKL
jgi:uracil-DNA glycosylase